MCWAETPCCAPIFTRPQEPFLCQRCRKLAGSGALSGGKPLTPDFARASGGEAIWRLARLLATQDYRWGMAAPQPLPSDAQDCARLQPGLHGCSLLILALPDGALYPPAHLHSEWGTEERCALLRTLCSLCAESAALHDTLHGEEDEVRTGAGPAPRCPPPCAEHQAAATQMSCWGPAPAFHLRHRASLALRSRCRSRTRGRRLCSCVARSNAYRQSWRPPSSSKRQAGPTTALVPQLVSQQRRAALPPGLRRSGRAGAGAEILLLSWRAWWSGSASWSTTSARWGGLYAWTGSGIGCCEPFSGQDRGVHVLL